MKKLLWGLLAISGISFGQQLASPLSQITPLNYASGGGSSAGVVIGVGSGLTLTGASSNVLNLGTASASTTGALTSTDWITFNAKQPALSFGNLTGAGSVSVSGGSGAVVGTGAQVSVSTAGAGSNGVLLSSDWNLFEASLGAVAALQIASATHTAQISALQGATTIIEGQITGITAQLIPFVGDGGSGGAQGLVPSPAPSTAEAGQFLSAGGTFAYVDQSKPIFNPFVLVNQTAAPQPYGVTTLVKYENLVVQGNHAYAIGTGNPGVSLSIFNIANQNAPFAEGYLTTGSVPWLSGPPYYLNGAYNLAVSGSYAYIGSSGSHSLYVVNVANPYNPFNVGQLQVPNSPGSLYGIAYQNGYAYLATQSQGLDIVDVGGGACGGTVSAPVNCFQEGGAAKSFGVAVSGTNLYTTQYSTASPYTIRQIKSWFLSPTGQVTTSTAVQSLQVPTAGEALGLTLSPSGSLAYVSVEATGVNVVDIVNISNPSAMANIAGVTASFTMNSAFVGIQDGSFLYVPSGSSATFGGAIDAFDISNPAAPFKVASTYTNQASSVFGGIALDGKGYIYSADYGPAPGSLGKLDVFTVPQRSSVIGTATIDSLTLAGVTVPFSQTNYLAGVSANVQTQINGLASAGSAMGPAGAVQYSDGSGHFQGGSGFTFSSGALTVSGLLGVTATLSSLTASAVVVTDGSDNLVSSSTTSTELGYVHGVTAAVQTQLNAKQPALSFGALSGNGSVSVSGGSGAVIGTGAIVSVATASASATGVLVSSDWNTFNIGAGLAGTAVQRAGDTMSGLLSAANFKDQGIISAAFLDTDGSGNVTAGTAGTLSGNGAVSVANGIGVLVGQSAQISVATAGTSANGILTQTDWNTFNVGSGLAGTAVQRAGDTMSGLLSVANFKNRGVLSASILATDANGNEQAGTQGTLSGLGSVSVSGGAAAVIGTGAVISITTAGASANGVLTQTDWNMFNGKQAALGYTPVNKAGDTMSGLLSAANLKDQGVLSASVLQTDSSGNIGAANSAGVISVIGYTPVNKAGDSMSGALSVNGNVSSNGFMNVADGNSYKIAGVAFVGVGTGIGASSTYVGKSAGGSVTSGTSNTFVGANAGQNATSGSNNTTVGENAGQGITSGNSNTIVGLGTGTTVSTSVNNTLIGAGANIGTDSVLLGTAIGQTAIVSASSAVQLGKGTNSIANSLQFNGFNFLTDAGKGTLNTLVLGGVTTSNLPSIFLPISSGSLTSIVANEIIGSGRNERAMKIENLVAAATSFTCAVTNPVITLFDCGTSAGACTSGTTTLASVTLTAANSQVSSTGLSATIAAGHYWAFELTAGSCTALSVNGSAEAAMQ